MNRKKNQRLSPKEISLIRSLTFDGKSLNYLSRLLGVDKTTIYYQVRKFKPRIKKEFNPTGLTDYQIGELMGAFAGDGNYYHQSYNRDFPKRSNQHKIRYFLTFSREKEYADYLFSLLKGLNLNPHTYSVDESVLVVFVNSKDYIEFIKKYLIWESDKTFTIRLKNPINSYPDSFLKGFARGLMDTDGFLNTSNAACACISSSLMDNLSEIFTKFKIDHSKTLTKRYGNQRDIVYVRAFRSTLNRFNDEIGFSSPHKQMTINNILKPKGKIKKPYSSP